MESDDDVNNIESLFSVLEEIEKNEPEKTASKLKDFDFLSSPKEESILKINEPSLVHNDDSSDDEGNRNHEHIYSDYGKEIKKILRKNDSNKIVNNLNPWGSQTSIKSNKEKDPGIDKTKASFSNNSTLIEKKENPVENIYIDPIFGIRISKPLMLSIVLKDKMKDRTAIPINKLQLQVETTVKNSLDWVVGGILVNKSDTRTSAKGNQYIIWTISDLKNDLKTFSVFLFKNAYKQLWKTLKGTVMAILNPDILENKSKKDVACLAVDTPEKILFLGQSKDLGYCKSKTKGGDNCNAFINASVCEFCIYHVKKEYNHYSNRSEFQHNNSSRGLEALRNKVLGKNEVFYGGKSYKAVPIKKNYKQMQKDADLLRSLSSDVITNKTNNTKKIKSSFATCIQSNNKQRSKDLELIEMLKGNKKEYDDKTTNISNYSIKENEIDFSETKKAAKLLLMKIKNKNSMQDKQNQQNVSENSQISNKKNNQENDKKYDDKKNCLNDEKLNEIKNKKNGFLMIDKNGKLPKINDKVWSIKPKLVDQNSFEEIVFDLKDSKKPNLINKISQGENLKLSSLKLNETNATNQSIDNLKFECKNTKNKNLEENLNANSRNSRILKLTNSKKSLDSEQTVGFTKNKSLSNNKIQQIKNSKNTSEKNPKENFILDSIIQNDLNELLPESKPPEDKLLVKKLDSNSNKEKSNFVETKKNSTKNGTNDIINPSTSKNEVINSRIRNFDDSIPKNKKVNLSVKITQKKLLQARLNALEYVAKHGPIGKPDPEKRKKRILEKIITDDETQNKKLKLDEQLLLKSKKFKEIMERKSSNEHLIEIYENEKQEEYFNKLEKKEQMEEKMLSTYKVPCKAVKCLQCKYINFASSDLCKQEGHKLHVFDTYKRFYKCGDCKSRTVTLELIPLHSCKKCGSSKWQRTAMIKEKIFTVNNDLSIRGAEEKYIGGAVKNASINLLIPDVGEEK